MKKNFYFWFFLGAFVLSSCAPVLSRNYLHEGEARVSFNQLRENPEPSMGRLYIMGGIIVGAKFTKTGSQIEAVHVPVDRYGYFKDRGISEGRFLALQEGKTLDPEIYARGRRVTLAGEFVATRKGKIDETEYTYPVFQIRQIYLWPKERRYSPPPYYYDPWFYPYPYYFGAPWWSFYYYSAPVIRPPVTRRAPTRGEPSPAPSPPPRREGEPQRR